MARIKGDTMNGRLWGIMVLGVLVGCSESNTPSQSGQGQIKMYLVDSAAAFDSVNVVVTRVEVHQANADSTSGWTTVNNVTSTYDLLTLQNGVNAVLGDTFLAAGQYTQIRLIVGDGCRVVLGGLGFPLEIPSGMETGLKLNHEFTIVENTLYELTLDFDVEHSVILTGAGQYMLKPVIRVVANAVSGSISGTILPLDARASVWTAVGSDTAQTVTDVTSGYFKLVALPEGTYALTIMPLSNAYRDTTLIGIIVIRGQDTPLGTILVSPSANE